MPTEIGLTELNWLLLAIGTLIAFLFVRKGKNFVAAMISTLLVGMFFVTRGLMMIPEYETLPYGPILLVLEFLVSVLASIAWVTWVGTWWPSLTGQSPAPRTITVQQPPALTKQPQLPQLPQVKEKQPHEVDPLRQPGVPVKKK